LQKFADFLKFWYVSTLENTSWEKCHTGLSCLNRARKPEMDKQLIDTRVASGLRDLTPKLARPREFLVDQFRRTFRLFGFQPIETPHIERREVLTGKGAGSEEVLRQIFDVTNTGGTPGELALRFDHTVPLARFVSAHLNELNLPFKRFAIGSVFRGERPAKGRFREFTQCDFDIVGSESTVADAEIVLVIHQSLASAGVPRSTIWLNHRGLLESLLDNVSARDRGPAVLRALDKLAKTGRESVAQELCNSEKGAGLSAAQADTILGFVESGRGGLSVLDHAERLLNGHEAATDALHTLRTIRRMLDEAGVSEDAVAFDLGLARGLDYYTGVVMETTVNGWERFGSISSGGRYDNLASLFSQRRIPGVGASIGLDRLVALLEESGHLARAITPEGVLVGQFPGVAAEVAFQVAAKIRAAGIAAECYPEPIAIGKQMAYGATRGYRFGLIMGPDELARGVFHLRDLTNRAETRDLDLQHAGALVAEASLRPMGAESLAPGAHKS
jgi:histidyl-tRNA synthetase